MKRRILAALTAAILLAGMLAGCGNRKEGTTGWVGVLKEEEFDDICIDMTIDEFNALGFTPGDSLNVSFDDGTVLEDIPYYTGYFVPIGELLVCGYPGHPHVVITRNYGDATWESFRMTDDSRVSVTINEKGKYLDVQELFALSYSNDRQDFPSDIAFANFRAVQGGSLREGCFYRSASPCDNQTNRASYANRLAEDAGIRFVLNLSDSEEKYLAHTEDADFNSDYYDSLYRDGNVLLLALNANYRSDSYAETVAEAFLIMTEHSGPCLIHCVEGKDRTGFVCALLLALADASAQEIIDDYMITYDNYFGVTQEEYPAKYEAIRENVDDFFYCMCDAEKDTPLESLDLKSGAENYLRRGGLSDAEIAQIEAYITA